MRHQNTSLWNIHDLLWEPVRAIGSSNRFYIDSLAELMWRRGDSFPFMEAFPDTRATGGNLALDDDGCRRRTCLRFSNSCSAGACRQSRHRLRTCSPCPRDRSQTTKPLPPYVAVNF